MDHDLLLEQRKNCDGSLYWYAERRIGSIFGSVVQGVCSGIGRTKGQALERLQEDEAQLYESLWE